MQQLKLEIESGNGQTKEEALRFFYVNPRNDKVEEIVTWDDPELALSWVEEIVNEVSSQ